jgi:hypothetical protein
MEACTAVLGEMTGGSSSTATISLPLVVGPSVAPGRLRMAREVKDPYLAFPNGLTLKAFDYRHGFHNQVLPILTLFASLLTEKT